MTKPYTIEIQTRSEETGLHTFFSWEDAFKAADMDPSIWKMSWTDTNGERVRLVRAAVGWTYEPIILPKEKEVGKQ